MRPQLFLPFLEKATPLVGDERTLREISSSDCDEHHSPAFGPAARAPAAAMLYRQRGGRPRRGGRSDYRAAALGQLGRTTEAKLALEKAVSRAPGAFDMYVRKRAPWFRPEDHAHLVEGLRKAGWNG